MAEGCDLKQNLPKIVSQENKGTLECAVCLQTCVHPALLPCGHIFCFLCVKGIANQSKRCAMCRQEIPRDFLERPKLLEPLDANKTTDSNEDTYQWFYEGRNGWWQYDERTNAELESAYKAGERTCELLVAGFLYVADFDSMLQLRRNDPSRIRRIKRDLSTIPKKGIAGLRIGEDVSLINSRDIHSTSPDTTDSNIGSGAVTPIPPSNTPQTPAGGNISGDVTPDRNESLHRAIDQIRSLSLRDMLEIVINSSDEEAEQDADHGDDLNSRK